MGYIYIITNQPRGVYILHNVVHYEAFDDIRDAITPEKQLKSWRRQWKIELVEKGNPKWEDLSHKIIEAESSSA